VLYDQIAFGQNTQAGSYWHLVLCVSALATRKVSCCFVASGSKDSCRRQSLLADEAPQSLTQTECQGLADHSPDTCGGWQPSTKPSAMSPVLRFLLLCSRSSDNRTVIVRTFEHFKAIALLLTQPWIPNGLPTLLDLNRTCNCFVVK
jgi:hypothetical protein